MIQHFLEERFHKTVRFFSSLIVKDLDVRGNVKIDGGLTVGGVDPLDKPYTTYVANVTQSGTTAPVATVLENTLGGTPVWARSGVGEYTLTLTGAFPADKVFTLPNNITYYSTGLGKLVNVQVIRTSNNVLTVFTTDTLGSALDEALLITPFEIRVYP